MPLYRCCPKIIISNHFFVRKRAWGAERTIICAMSKSDKHRYRFRPFDYSIECCRIRYCELNRSTEITWCFWTMWSPEEHWWRSFCTNDSKKCSGKNRLSWCAQTYQNQGARPCCRLCTRHIMNACHRADWSWWYSWLLGGRVQKRLQATIW